MLRVNNFAAVEDYTLTVTYEGPPPFRAAQQETYTLTCERDGAVLATQPVLVERGEAKTLVAVPGGGAERRGPAPDRRRHHDRLRGHRRVHLGRAVSRAAAACGST